MNVVKCKNGHFFDGDSYSVCPHCGESINSNNEITSNVGKKKDIWHRKNRHNDTKKQQINTTPVSNNYASEDISGTNPTDVISNEIPSAQHSQNPGKTPTLDFWDTPSHETLPTAVDEPNQSVENNYQENESDEEIASKESIIREEKSSSLRDVVRQASANSEGKTMSYFSVASAENNKTERKEDAAANPVVGWIVCTNGKHFGECFNIVAGKNSIGRNNDNAIVLNKDNKISRSKHAIITYEPKKRNFYLQPGDSSGLTYLNDDYIDESKKLQPRDVIELGDSKFIFVPLCNESFSWEDYLA